MIKKYLRCAVLGLLFSSIVHIVVLLTFWFLFENVGELIGVGAVVVLISIASRLYYYVRGKGDFPLAVTGAALLFHVLLSVLENWLISLMANHWLWSISISLGIGYGKDLTYAIVTGLLLFALAAVLIFDLMLTAIKRVYLKKLRNHQNIQH